MEKLRSNPLNPKKPMGLKYLKGLRASLKTNGFSGLFIVAPIEDGEYEVLDGNTRFDELAKAGIEQVPCVIRDDLDTIEKRKMFVLGFDRHRKQFDESSVVEQIRELAKSGIDTKTLETISCVDNIANLITERTKKAAEAVHASAKSSKSAGQKASLVLYGPSEDIDSIKELAKQIHGRMSGAEKLHAVLTQSTDAIDWTDEMIVSIILATIGRYQEALADG